MARQAGAGMHILIRGKTVKGTAESLLTFRLENQRPATDAPREQIGSTDFHHTALKRSIRHWF